jgi:hypothetical protein
MSIKDTHTYFNDTHSEDGEVEVIFHEVQADESDEDDDEEAENIFDGSQEENDECVFDFIQDDESQDDDESQEDDDEISSVFSSLDVSFTYNFGNINEIYELIDDSDEDFDEYLRSEFMDECGESSPVYVLFKLYRSIFKGKEELIVVLNYLRKLSTIFSTVFAIHSRLQEDEMENILFTKHLLLFRIFVENCRNEECETAFLYQELIISDFFHLDKIQLIEEKEGGVLNNVIFNVIRQNSCLDYGNDKTYEHIIALLQNQRENFTEDHEEMLMLPDTASDIRDFFV